MSHHELLLFFIAVATLLASARVMGELAIRLRQPAVLGEILAGILLGPTVLGYLAPGISLELFPKTGNVAIALQGLTSLAVVLFLLVAGMELDLSLIWRQGRSSLFIGFFGLAFPFITGLAVAWAIPTYLLGEAPANSTVFALFIATAMTISALPVIAKTLMDINLYKTDIGMLIIATAMIDDFIGWNIFGVILGMIEQPGDSSGFPVPVKIGLTIAFAFLMLTLGRLVLNRMLPWIQAHTSWPGGVLGFAMAGALASAAMTEYIGIHAIFGSFLFGIALGDSPHLRERSRATLDQFISFVFAPLFFASIGLKVNFFAHFNLPVVLIVLAIATIGKVFGCWLGARLSGLANRESWAIGFGMNARGSMEIILGMLALEKHLINEQVFVALVVMALVTSMISGTMIERILQRRKPVLFTEYLTARTFRKTLAARDRRDAILELTRHACEGNGLDAAEVGEIAWDRERIIPTGIGNGLAIPHARVDKLKAPIVALGISRQGVDFDSPDGKPARLIFLILTPSDQPQTQLEILAHISRTCREEAVVERLVRAENYTEILALVKSSVTPAGH